MKKALLIFAPAILCLVTSAFAEERPMLAGTDGPLLAILMVSENGLHLGKPDLSEVVVLTTIEFFVHGLKLCMEKPEHHLAEAFCFQSNPLFQLTA